MKKTGRSLLAAAIGLWILGFSFVTPIHAAELGLDTIRIQTIYKGGDFETALAELEPLVAPHSSTLISRADSLFVAKYLGVIYAANPGTREKGRYYMLRMLDMNPDAELLDMFVGEDVDKIFDKVRREHLAKRQAQAAKIKAPMTRAQPLTDTVRQTSNQKPAPERQAPTVSSTQGSRNKTWWIWTSATLLGGTLLGAAYYWYSDTQQEPEKKVENLKVELITPQS